MPEIAHIPQGKLTPFVEFMWYSDDYRPASRKERVLPSGASQLIINLGDEKFHHFQEPDDKKGQEFDPIILTGITTGYIFLDSYLRISTMGVVLKPGAVTALFGIPAGKFRDRVVPFHDISEADTTGLRQRLVHVSSPETKFKLLASFLVNHIKGSFKPKPAVIYAANQVDIKNGTQPISEILDKLGYSRRWFSEIFKEAVGITPKQYSRITRFQHTLRMIRKCSSPDWTNLALACGYYDQPHFIHDFKDLSGISPEKYYQTQSDQINHLPA